MYFYLLSRHCQQGSRFLQFVHEINGVESKAGLLWVKYISLYAVFVLWLFGLHILGLDN